MNIESFEAFFEEVHGHPPFPWQSRLAERVVDSGGWPPLLDLPTGVGKTSALDVALYALARNPGRAPRRIFLVVDRRIIVDQAAVHARGILARLMEGAAPGVARSLRELFGGEADEAPFEVAALRGGMPRETDWASRPDRPVVASSTVDQVGSRLLFRGYGVSARMAPVHAGLLGHDALYLLDEVHLSRPFADTLEQIRARWRNSASIPGHLERFGVVQMSATPGDSTDEAFGLTSADRAHPVITKRLGASKRAELAVVAVRGRDEGPKRETLARAAAERARALVKGGARSVAVVLNRVDAAREAWRALAHDSSLDACLVTGRMRPVERERIYSEQVEPRAKAGRSRQADERPLVVAATQTIEAGADLDFDALVTECASLDALRQRFGRVDRRGELERTESVILIRSDQVDGSDDDPIYGSALAATWSFLSALEEVDFGIDALSSSDEPDGLIAPASRAPTLLPSYLDAWASTSPRPEPDPDIALWLHGIDPSSPEVQVVWRSDLQEEALERLAGDDSAERARVEAALAACPPSPAEAVTVTIGAARAWLSASELEVSLADVGPGARVEDRARESRRAVRWDGSRVEVVDARGLAPGDTIVVPAARGGLTAANWDPLASEPVRDFGDEAQSAYGRPPTWRPFVRVDSDPEPPTLDAEDEVSPRQRILEWLADVRERAGDEPSEAEWVRRFRALGPTPSWTILPGGDVVFYSRRARKVATTEGDEGSLIGQAVSLSDHSRHVRTWAQRFVDRLGLPPALARAVVTAAWFHDLGKADPRFQMWLCGGSEVRLAVQDVPLAKSGMTSHDRQSIREARRRSGYPEGERHELTSVRLLESSPSVLEGIEDPELVLHLVGSHHGWCRPFAPPIDDPEPVKVEVELDGDSFSTTSRHGLGAVGSGAADRFWGLTQRYGWWGLAWLETLVRLADHRASERGEG